MKYVFVWKKWKDVVVVIEDKVVFVFFFSKIIFIVKFMLVEFENCLVKELCFIVELMFYLKVYNYSILMMMLFWLYDDILWRSSDFKII